MEERAGRHVLGKINYGRSGEGESHFFSAANLKLGRSFTLQGCHLSEAAFYPHSDVNIPAILESVPNTPNSAVVWETTSAGYNFFREKFYTPEEQDGYRKMFLSWYHCPEYSTGFRNESERDKFEKVLNSSERELMARFPEITLENMKFRWDKKNENYGGSDIAISIEYPSYPEEAFRSSSRNFYTDLPGMIENWKLINDPENGMAKKLVRFNIIGAREKRAVRGKDPGDYWVFESANPNREYVMGVDVASGEERRRSESGVEADRSAFVVADRGYYLNAENVPEPVSVVADFTAHMEPLRFCDCVEFAAREYGYGKLVDVEPGAQVNTAKLHENSCWIMVESNNEWGAIVIQELKKRHLRVCTRPDYYEEKSRPKLALVGLYRPKIELYGWHSSGKSKPFAHDKVANMLRDGSLVIPSERILIEMDTFRTTLDTEKGNFDDLVTSLALAIMADKFSPRRTTAQREMTAGERAVRFEEATSALQEGKGSWDAIKKMFPH